MQPITFRIIAEPWRNQRTASESPDEKKTNSCIPFVPLILIFN